MNDTQSALLDALARAERHAPFLRRLAAREAEVTARLAAGDLPGALALARAEEGGTVAAALRRERRRLALAAAVGDLAGLLPLEQVTGLLSDLADRALDRAVAAAIAERTPGAEPVGFAVLALGKHGSGELNYSSDIDPVLIFDPATLPHRGREEPAEAAARIARRVVELLQAPDADGFVFRVDLRLRPSPEATPPAIPVNAAIGYYESSACGGARSISARWARSAPSRAASAATTPPGSAWAPATTSSGGGAGSARWSSSRKSTN
jgi:[glutamine synthetase] adenylyltransferase / [glutamine synthetase]-adenylyl-L-tyrosine phosphorylase